MGKRRAAASSKETFLQRTNMRVSSCNSMYIYGILCIVAAAQNCSTVSDAASNATSITSVTSRIQAAAAAWVYGLPALAIAQTRNFYLNAGIPLNYVQPARILSNAQQRTIVRPNADTLYSIAFFDLSQGPVTLHIPSITSRYFVAALYSAYTENFANPGTLEGSPAGNYKLYGPDYASCASQSNASFNIISPTNDVTMIARFYVLNATAGYDDYKLVNAQQDELVVVDAPVTILSAEPSFSNKTSTAFTSYYFMNEAISQNPLLTAAYNQNFSSAGLFSGRSFRSTLSMQNLTTAQSMGNASISGAVGQPGYLRNLGNGWTLPTTIGIFGEDYRARAYIANFGLFALEPSQAIYPTYIGGSLSSVNNTSYTVFFADGEPPMAPLGFWSLTVYDAAGFFVQNTIDRYSLGSRDSQNFVKSSNGSFSITVSPNPPASGEGNWLPAPTEQTWIPTLRIYGAQDAARTGAWAYPVISKIS